jgi:nucleoside-diphosphate-sugar epimerase
MRKISILGCGWLGLPLAQQLIGKGFDVKGSTTSEHKIAELKSAKIIPFQIEMADNEIIGDIDGFLEESEILVINIPPKMRSSTNNDYSSKIQSIIPFVKSSTVSKVIFVSSTSVYQDNNELINESTAAYPETPSGKQLLDAERKLQKELDFQTTVLRFGGLIGKSRHPINSLAGRKNIENPKAPINLIHLDDCIGIIERIIEQDFWGEILNGVTPFHPSREEYYQQKAAEKNLPLPEFDHHFLSQGKTISSSKVENILKYQFKVNPL